MLLFKGKLKDRLDQIEYFILDMEKLEYMSLAGLRVVLAAQKRMSKRGRMLLRHVPEVIMEIFKVTGFVDILTIEQT